MMFSNGGISEILFHPCPLRKGDTFSLNIFHRTRKSGFCQPVLQLSVINATDPGSLAGFNHWHSPTAVTLPITICFADIFR
jgi:hypothetical protein